MKKKIIITTAVILVAGAAGIGAYAVNNMLPARTAQTTEFAAEQIIDTDDPVIENKLQGIVGSGYMDIVSADEETETPAETGSMAAGTKPGDEAADADREDNKPSGTVAGNTGNSTGAAAGNTTNSTGTGTQISGNGSQTVPAAQGNGSSSTPTAPASTAGSTAETGSGSGTHAGQTWHPPVYENVWVVDKAAWTEEVPKYETKSREICRQCGAVMYTQDEVTNHFTTVGSTCYSCYSDYYQVQVGTTTINWPEEGHWEQKLVKEGYWE